MLKNLTGIILAGGKSSRFNSPKYLAKINGSNLLELAIAKIRPFCSEIVVVSKNEIATLPRQVGVTRNDVLLLSLRGTESPHSLSSGQAPQSQTVNVVNIVEKDRRFHPLIGIKEGLKSSKTDNNLVLACDMPFISKRMILGLIPSPSHAMGGGSQGGGVDVRLYRHKGKAEPLLGFYRKNCLEEIIKSLTPITNHQSPTTKALRIIEVLDKCHHQYIDIDSERIDFFNINTKEDLIEAQKIAQDNPKLLSN